MKILIVEDEYKIANALKRGLEQERYAAEAVYDGESGLAAAEADEYDLIVLDRMLPEIDGIEVCRRLRESGDRTPILMLTAKDQVRDRVAGLDAGADDYLVKPFAFEELLARIRALLRRPSQSQDTVLRVGDLTLDPATFEVRRSNKLIELSAKEFALLEYLMRNEGRVINKDTIISHVWEYDADILPNTVEVYIGYLRNKIDRPYKQSLLKTKRGFGYVLSAQ
ncbi:response regulator transcription factor [bacterium]|nr:response regulator transcription factor [bacterium]